MVLESGENQIKEVHEDEQLYFLLRQIFPSLDFHFARIEVYLLSSDDMYYEIEIYDSPDLSY